MNDDTEKIAINITIPDGHPSEGMPERRYEKMGDALEEIGVITMAGITGGGESYYKPADLPDEEIVTRVKGVLGSDVIVEIEHRS